MELFAVLKLYGPLAALAGGAYAIVRQAFAFVWRLAAVEKQSAETAAAVAEIKKPLERMAISVARIEERIEAMSR